MCLCNCADSKETAGAPERNKNIIARMRRAGGAALSVRLDHLFGDSPPGYWEDIAMEVYGAIERVRLDSKLPS
jgi:hypothetical protein